MKTILIALGIITLGAIAYSASWHDDFNRGSSQPEPEAVGTYQMSCATTGGQYAGVQCFIVDTRTGQMVRR